MPVNIEKKNLKITKTEKAVNSAMFTLLNHQNFSKITVNSICNEALVSRATFYSYFTDKYNLLEFGLLSSWTYKVTEADSYETIKECINETVSENKKIIKNLLTDADNQILEIVQNFLCSVLEINNTKHIDEKVIQKNIVAANLYIGGVIYYLLWQVRNNFPSDMPIINEYSFDIIKMLYDWAKEQ